MTIEIILLLIGMLALAAIVATLALLMLYLLAGTCAYIFNLSSASTRRWISNHSDKQPSYKSTPGNDSHQNSSIIPYLKYSINAFCELRLIHVLKSGICKTNPLIHCIKSNANSRCNENPRDYAPDVASNQAIDCLKGTPHAHKSSTGKKACQPKVNRTL